jgi:hypothetical protein
MPKFTLIGEHTDLDGNPDGTKVTYEFHVDRIDSVLEHVDLFIRGCGYNPTGILDYIHDDEYYDEPTIEDWNRADNYRNAPIEVTEEMIAQFAEQHGHSKYYYDYDRNKSVNHTQECGK